METNKESNNIKLEVIEAFIAHETGKPLKYTNSQYDEMLAKVKEYDPNFNPFEYLPIPEGSSKHEHRSGIIDLAKYSPEGNDIAPYWNNEEGKIKTPKYDGSDIIIYYTNGVLSHILSMGDKEVGVVQTDKFCDFVPQKVDPEISFIRAEVLVDVRDYDGARGKANGLVNSKYLQDEVDKLATLVGLHAVDINGNILKYNDFINKIHVVIKNERLNRVTYFSTPECKDIDLVERGIAHYKKDYPGISIDLKFCIDGIVYTEDGDNDPYAYKYDWLTTAETTVLGINWRETNGEGFTSVLEIEEVELDDKTIRNVSTNGVPELLRLGCGVGSKIEVAFAKTTIPKVVEVIEEAAVELPKCHCGYQLTETDIVGALLKCPNPECIAKYNLRKDKLNNYLEWNKTEEWNDFTNEEFILKNLEDVVFFLLNIPRFSYANKHEVPFDDISSNLLDIIKEKNTNAFIELIWKSYKMSDLQGTDLDRNSYSTVKVLNEILNGINN